MANSKFSNEKLEIEYIATSKEVRISKITPLCNQDEIVIPDEINGVPVVAIKEKAVQKSGFTFKSIKLPAHLISIKKGAFNGLKGIKKFIIPASVEEIENEAFKNCKDLEEIIFEEGSHIKRIGSYVFDNDIKLKELRLPEGLVAIDLHNLVDQKRIAVYLPMSLDYSLYVKTYYSRPCHDIYIHFDLELIDRLEKTYGLVYDGFYDEDELIKKDGITYQVFGDTAIVKSIEAKRDEPLVIPDEITVKNKKVVVKGIGPRALYRDAYRGSERVSIASLSLPKHLELICCYALGGFDVDSVVDIPSSIKLLGHKCLDFTPRAFYFPHIDHDYLAIYPIFYVNTVVFKEDHEPIKYLFKGNSYDQEKCYYVGENHTVHYEFNRDDLVIIDQVQYALKNDKAAIIAVDKSLEEFTIPEIVTYQNKTYQVNTLLSKSLNNVKSSIKVPKTIHYIFDGVFNINISVQFEDTNTLVCIGDYSFHNVATKEINLSDKLQYILGSPIDRNDSIHFSFDMSNLKYLGVDSLCYLDNDELHIGKSIEVLAHGSLPHNIEHVSIEDGTNLRFADDFLSSSRGYKGPTVEGKYQDGGFYIPSDKNQALILYQYDSIGRPFIEIPDGVVAIAPNALELCCNLIGLTLPDSLMHLNTVAPRYLKSLRMNIPKSLKTIDKSIYDILDEKTKQAIPQDVRIVNNINKNVCDVEVRWFDE